MRAFLFVTSTLLLGAALGSGVAVWRIKSAPWNPKFDESSQRQSKPASSAQTQSAPKALVPAYEHDFGLVEQGVKRHHDFEFTNGGSVPLTLTAGSASGGNSIDLKFERSSLPPGASEEVTATWTPRGTAGPVQDTVEVLTNDPARPSITLTLSGKIVDPLRLVTPDITVTRLPAGKTTTFETPLYCYLDEPLKILGHEWSDATTARYFDVALKQFSESELKSDTSSQSGYLVKVTMKAGLPPGPLQQKLILRTNVASSPTVSLSIHGMIAGDITVVNRDWDGNAGVLNLGHVARAEGLKRTVTLVVRGPSRHDVQFSVAEVTPKFIKIGVGQARNVNDSSIVEVPVTIEIPSGSPPGAYLGTQQNSFGEIILHTTHPQTPTFKIRLRFVIEG